MDALSTLRCSVVMPTKDRVEMALSVLRCILNQTLMIDQIVIVDDGSTVSASTMLDCVLSQFVAEGVNVIHLRYEVSRGVSCARNAGFDLADGDIVMFCDSDDYWHPQKVELSMHHFQRNPESQLFVHAFRWIDGTQILFRLMREGGEIVVPRWLAVLFAFANPSCMCIRKRGFDQRWDEGKRYHEDLDFILLAMDRHQVTFRNSFMMTMGRAPGEIGGATQNLVLMRRGAIEALDGKAGGFFERVLITAKIAYHRWRLRGLEK